MPLVKTYKCRDKDGREREDRKGKKVLIKF